MKLIPLLAVLLAFAFMADFSNSTPAHSSTGLQYDLSWNTIDSGGGTSTSASYELSGTIGQPDAGEMVGGDYALAGGFWTGGAAGAPCLGDITGDNTVDGADLLILLSSWGDCPGCASDLTGDDTVDGADLLILLSAWGDCS